MRREFKIGMFLAPVTLIMFLGIKALFAPATTVDEEEKSEILQELNYSQSFSNTAIPQLAFHISQNGKPIEKKFADFKGKPTIVHIWATWCGPCQKEMPLFNKFASKYGSSFNILGLSVDMSDNVNEAHTKVSSHCKEKGYTSFDLALDHTVSLSKALQITGVPTTILLNANGKEIGRFNGIVNWNDPKVLKIVESIFA